MELTEEFDSIRGYKVIDGDPKTIEDENITEQVSRLERIKEAAEYICGAWKITIDEIDNPTGTLDIHDWIKLMRYSAWPELALALEAHSTGQK